MTPSKQQPPCLHPGGAPRTTGVGSSLSSTSTCYTGRGVLPATIILLLVAGACGTTRDEIKYKAEEILMKY
jgi:hypothetical protein